MLQNPDEVDKVFSAASEDRVLDLEIMDRSKDVASLITKLSTDRFALR